MKITVIASYQKIEKVMPIYSELSVRSVLIAVFTILFAKHLDMNRMFSINPEITCRYTNLVVFTCQTADTLRCRLKRKG